MQDIPRNELLDKLAAGWKLRRKSWPDKRAFFEKDWPMINVEYLLADDLEGEPPRPILIESGMHIYDAFWKLKNNLCSYVRRSSWPIENKISMQFVRLSFEDLTADDWEVWG